MKALAPIVRTSLRCLVCGFAEVRTDVVLDRGWVLLSECPRCSHRATEPLASSAHSLRAQPRVTPAAA